MQWSFFSAQEVSFAVAENSPTVFVHDDVPAALAELNCPARRPAGQRPAVSREQSYASAAGTFTCDRTGGTQAGYREDPWVLQRSPPERNCENAHFPSGLLWSTLSI